MAVHFKNARAEPLSKEPPAFTIRQLPPFYTYGGINIGHLRGIANFKCLGNSFSGAGAGDGAVFVHPFGVDPTAIGDTDQS